MLTKQALMDMNPGEYFRQGLTIDNPSGVNMANTDKMLRWVAVRGEGYWDWTIYIHEAIFDDWEVAREGDKVSFKEHIQKLVPCDEEALSLYRF